MAYVEKETRVRLNALSKQVWGAPSRWMQHLQKGVVVYADEKEQMLLNIESGTKNIKYKVTKWYTEESIELLMLEMLKKMQESHVKKI